MAPLASGLTWPDYLVLGAALACLLLIGGAFTREQRDTAEFFLARRRIPWWAACLSFLATEISAVTIISVPATAYSENWEYGQFFVGSSLAKFAVAFLFIPAFYRYNCTTIYEFLLFRFGQASQVTITRLLMRHSIEEKMMELKKRKLKLYRALLEDARHDSGGSIGREDFEFLLGP